LVCQSKLITPQANPWLAATIVQRFSFLVYDRYLDRIELLRRDDLVALLEAEAFMRAVKQDASLFLDLARGAEQRGEQSPEIKARAVSVSLQVPRCFELLKTAIKNFDDGSFIQSQEAERGKQCPSIGKLAPGCCAKS